MCDVKVQCGTLCEECVGEANDEKKQGVVADEHNDEAKRKW